MQPKLKYIEPNKWYHKLYNSLSVKRIESWRQLFTDAEKKSALKPLFVTGFFRSGTSLTTQLIQTLGMNLGPEHHLLSAKNSRADWNPNGFFENYLFMEASLLAFVRMNSWGHIPPSEEQVKNFEFTEEDRNIFAEFTVCGVHDDRISNKNKSEILKKYDVLSLNTYLQNEFVFPFAIKNPHFSVLSSFLLKKWPEAKFLVCFREPVAALASAAKITPMLTEEIYCRYYSELIKLPADKVCFFSYDHLLENPVKSITNLCNSLQLDAAKINNAVSIINPSLHRFKEKQEYDDKQLNTIYKFMLSEAVNT